MFPLGGDLLIYESGFGWSKIIILVAGDYLTVYFILDE